MSDQVLRVNPILCDAHGLCAELFPERIELDEWGYPIIDGSPVPRSLEAACAPRRRGLSRPRPQARG